MCSEIASQDYSQSSLKNQIEFIQNLIPKNTPEFNAFFEEAKEKVKTPEDIQESEVENLESKSAAPQKNQQKTKSGKPTEESTKKSKKEQNNSVKLAINNNQDQITKHFLASGILNIPINTNFLLQTLKDKIIFVKESDITKGKFFFKISNDQKNPLDMEILRKENKMQLTLFSNGELFKDLTQHLPSLCSYLKEKIPEFEFDIDIKDNSENNNGQNQGNSQHKQKNQDNNEEDN